MTLPAPSRGSRPRETGLTRAGTLVIDSASATAYVPCDSGKLCPALNEASALLALDSAQVHRVTVSQASLSHYEIGPTIGVAGLPQDLPAATVALRHVNVQIADLKGGHCSGLHRFSRN